MPIGRRKEEDYRYFGAKSKRRSFASFRFFAMQRQRRKDAILRHFIFSLFFSFHREKKPGITKRRKLSLFRCEAEKMQFCVFSLF